MGQLYYACSFLSRLVNCSNQRYEQVQNYIFPQLLKIRIEDFLKLNVPAIGAMKHASNMDIIAFLLLASLCNINKMKTEY